MDPRVRTSQRALDEQYRLARRIASLSDQSYAAHGSADAAGHSKAADAFAALNADAESLLDTVEGADAPPTRQAIEAFGLLEGQMSTIQKR
jgi:hypothetical protein